jgi:hypothetical protein
MRTYPVEYLLIVLVDEFLSPQRAFFCEHEINGERIRTEVTGSKSFFDLFGAVEEEVGSRFGFHVIREPGMERAKVPFIEVVVEAV